MLPYRRIVCPIDFSEVSRTALQWSHELATQFSAELTVVHAVDTTELGIGNLAAVPGGVDESRMRARESFRQWCRESALPDLDLLVVDGRPFEKIITTTQKQDADLVVMGTHGHSGVERLLLGSVTEKVLHRISAPLLTVSPESASATDSVPFRPRRVLVAIDFGVECERVVSHGCFWGKHFDAELVVMHVVPIPYVVLNESTLEGLRPAQIDAIQKRLSEERRKELFEKLPADSGVTTKVAVRVGSPFEHLRRVIDEERIDLAVLGAGGHGSGGLSWLGSTCHKFVRAAPCPVLTVR